MQYWSFAAIDFITFQTLVDRKKEGGLWIAKGLRNKCAAKAYILNSSLGSELISNQKKSYKGVRPACGHAEDLSVLQSTALAIVSREAKCKTGH